jgi:glyoxylate/hydroxypyruvate reductase A
VSAPELAGYQRRFLRGQAHPLRPLVHVGEGGLSESLLGALDEGQISSAALDVFNEEPLPPDHPYWGHPRVVVTPHIAAFSVPATAVESVVANLRRMEAGEAPLYVVDFERGY